MADQIYVYRPLDPNTISISVEGIVVRQAGLKWRGNNKVLDGWVGKTLRKEIFDPNAPAPVAPPAAPAPTDAPAHVTPPDAVVSEVLVPETSKFPTAEELDGLNMRELREYAAQFNISGRSKKRIIEQLVEADKVAK